MQLSYELVGLYMQLNKKLLTLLYFFCENTYILKKKLYNSGKILRHTCSLFKYYVNL